MIYVYAIGERDGELVPFVRQGVDRPPAPDEASLREHDQVVATLMEDGPVLPMRFGTVLRDEHALREFLREQAGELRARLEHVRGRVEIGVRAEWEGEPIVASCGSEFMRAKFERRSAARRAAAELHESLKDLAVDSVLQLCPREDTMFSAAYLVERSDAERFAEHAHGVTVTGPWPPYSFSG